MLKPVLYLLVLKHRPNSPDLFRLSPISLATPIAHRRRQPTSCSHTTREIEVARSCVYDLVKLGKLTDYTEPMSLLDFKRSVAIGLLSLGFNYPFHESKITGFQSTIPLDGRRSNNRRKYRLSVRDQIGFSGFCVHMPIFVRRGRGANSARLFG